jgi:hypothetical protein
MLTELCDTTMKYKIYSSIHKIGSIKSGPITHRPFKTSIDLHYIILTTPIISLRLSIEANKLSEMNERLPNKQKPKKYCWCLLLDSQVKCTGNGENYLKNPTSTFGSNLVKVDGKVNIQQPNYPKTGFVFRFCFVFFFFTCVQYDWMTVVLILYIFFTLVLHQSSSNQLIHERL